MKSHTAEYLIIGNSAAGISAAETLRSHSEDASITIVSDEPYASYGRPLISYLIEGKTSEDRIWLRDDGFYEDNNLVAMLGPSFKVVSLVPDSHEAVLANGERIQYGKCLLATGSVPFVPPIKGLSGASNVYSFMKLDDAKLLWGAVKTLKDEASKSSRKSRVVVIGAGLIGLKAAEAISSYTDEVLVLELAPRILPAVLDSEGAAILQTMLERYGIICKLGISANELIQQDGRITSIRLTNGDVVDCDLVVTAVGVRPNSSLAVDAGANQGRGLICDETLQTSLPDIYAAGDIVQVTDSLDGSQHPLALWPNAVQQGKAAALFMCESPDAVPYDGSFAVNAVDFFEASLLTSGVINPPDGDEYEQTVFSEDGKYAKFVTKDGCLMGYILLNRPDNAGIYTSLIENGIDLSTVSDDVFTDAPLNLSFDAQRRWDRLHRGYPSDRHRNGWKKVPANA